MTNTLGTFSRSIAGKTAIVTGAGSGMGLALSRLLIDQKVRVGLLDVAADAIDALAVEIADAGGEALAIATDVSSQTAVETAVNEVRTAFGPIDLLVNNAGVSMAGTIDSNDDEYHAAWARTLEINLTAHTLTIRACLEDLARNGEGRIVNVASTEGLGATPGISAYTASKHGVIGLTKSLAVELGRRGITVNCVCPGPIRTGMTAEIPDEHKDKFARRRVPVGRYGDPEEVAHGMLNFLLPASSYMNGAVLVVDGGMTAQNV